MIPKKIIGKIRLRTSLVCPDCHKRLTQVDEDKEKKEKYFQCGCYGFSWNSWYLYGQTWYQWTSSYGTATWTKSINKYPQRLRFVFDPSYRKKMKNV